MNRAYWIFAAVFLFSSACFDSQDGKALYQTSFESSRDLNKWSNVTESQRTKKAAPGMGTHSLTVGGGCIQPATSLVMEGVEPGLYRLTCWAQIVDGSGASILIGPENGQKEVLISGTDWKQYNSEEFEVSENSDKLRLDVMVGGIVAGSVAIDGLVVERVVH